MFIFYKIGSQELSGLSSQLKSAVYDHWLSGISDLLVNSSYILLFILLLVPCYYLIGPFSQLANVVWNSPDELEVLEFHRI